MFKKMAAVSFFLEVLVCVLLVFCTGGVLSEEKSDSKILHLNDENFDDVIGKSELILVEFYVDWCVYCRKLEPHLEEAARQLAPHGVQVAMVDIEHAKKTQANFQLTDLPDLRVFRKGEAFKYGGDLNNLVATGIVNYMLDEKASSTGSAIIKLTEENFDRIVNSADLILVDFYLKECLPCRQLEPIFAAAARRLQDHDPPILMGVLDIPSNMKVAQRFPMTNFPLLKMFRRGQEFNYTGPKTEDGMVQYMEKQAGPSSTYLSSAKDVQAFISSPKESRAVAFFSSETSSSLVQAYIDSGDLVRMDVKLGHTTDKKIAAELKFQVDTVVFYHPQHLVTKYEEGYAIMRDLEDDSKTLSDRYLDALRPLVGQMTKINMLRAYRRRPLLVAYYEMNWDKEHRENTQYWHSMIASVAIKYAKTDLSFAIADENEFEKDLKALGFSDWGEDVAVGIFAPGPRKFRMTEELTKDNLEEFVDAFLEKKLAPFYNSEPPPKDSKGPVKTVVGQNFKKTMYNRKKNTILMMCIPQLPNCKKATEWYHNLAKRFHKKSKDVVFGEMNVELNDPPIDGLNIDELPAFFFSGIDYRDEELDMVSPTPQDDVDMLVWLRRKANIRPPKANLNKRKENKKPKEEL